MRPVSSSVSELAYRPPAVLSAATVRASSTPADLGSASSGSAHYARSGVSARRVGVGDPLLGAAASMSRPAFPYRIKTPSPFDDLDLDDLGEPHFDPFDLGATAGDTKMATPTPLDDDSVQ